MRKFCGLNNCGATCYLSAVVQAVNHTASYKTLVMDGGLRDEKLIEKIVDGSSSLDKNRSAMLPLSALQILLTQLGKTIEPSLETFSLCSAFGMTKKDMSTQEDANEFFKRLLELLDVACKQYGLDKVYKDTCESVYIQELRCSSCGHLSETEQRHVDLLLPITPDLFESLTRYFQPEEISGYQCSSCGKKITANRALRLQQQAEVFAITLQRFVYDFQLGGYRKDASAVQCPVALDMSWVGKLSFSYLDEMARQLLNRDSLGDAERRQIFAEALRVFSQPWEYLRPDPSGKNNGAANQQPHKITWLIEPSNVLVRKMVEADGQFISYVCRHYSGGVVQAFEVDSTYSLPRIDAKAPPPGLYMLQAIVCHIGGLNSGHYYTLAFNSSKEFNSLQLVELNDETVTIQGNPGKILDYIAGKTTQAVSEDSTTQTRKLSGYGNTGYMYYYQSVSRMVQLQGATPAMPACVHAQIEARNEKQMEQQCRIDLQIVSNYESDSCFFLEKNDIPQYLYVRDGDYRENVSRFFQDYIATYNLKGIDPSQVTVYKLCPSSHISALQDIQLSRITIIKPGESMDVPLQSVLPGFVPKPTLFFELPCKEPFDPWSTYVSVTELSAPRQEKLRLGRRDVVKLGQKSVQLAESIYQSIKSSPSVPGRWRLGVLKVAVACTRVSAIQDIGLLCSQIILFRRAPNQTFYEGFMGSDDSFLVDIYPGEQLFCEFLPLERSLPAQICPVIGAKTGQREGMDALEFASDVLQYQKALKTGFNAVLLGQNGETLQQCPVRREDSLRNVFDFEQLAGGTELGFQCFVGQSQKGTFQKAAQVDDFSIDFASLTARHPGLISANNNASGQKLNTITFKIEFNQSPLLHYFSFAVAMQNQLPDIFVLAQHQCQLHDGDTVAALWTHFLRQNASQTQLKETQAPVSPIGELRFFWIPQQAAYDKMHSQQFRVLLTGSAEIPPSRKLEKRQFKERFFIYVDYISDVEKSLLTFCPKVPPITYASIRIFWEQYVEIARIPISQRTTAAQFQAFVDSISAGNGHLYMSINKRQVPVSPTTDMGKVNPEYWIIK